MSKSNKGGADRKKGDRKDVNYVRHNRETIYVEL